EEGNRRLIARLRQAGVNMGQPGSAPAAAPLPLAGMEIVVTGQLESMSRSQAEARFKALGGAVGASVSRKTTHLLAGASPGSKLERARALGTAIITEAEFLKLIGESR
ncbi:MAG: BRCT domain-containing protein, partial [Chloroflexota bacterium]